MDDLKQLLESHKWTETKPANNIFTKIIFTALTSSQYRDDFIKEFGLVDTFRIYIKGFVYFNKIEYALLLKYRLKAKYVGFLKIK